MVSYDNIHRCVFHLTSMLSRTEFESNIVILDTPQHQHQSATELGITGNENFHLSGGKYILRSCK